MRYSDHMFCLMRSLLIWLLVLAVPAQGAAVAAMVGCGPRHPAAAVAGPHGHDHANAQAHPHANAHANAYAHARADAGGPAAHDQHHAALPAPAADAGLASAIGSAAADAPAAGAADGHKCSACASCCAAGAILNTVPTVPMPALADAVFADWVASVDPYAVDGPDRPPRPVLA